MALYKIGDKVVQRDTEEHGVVIEVKPPLRGRQLYVVQLVDHATDIMEDDLVSDCDISNPFDRCSSGIFGSYSEYSKINTTFKIKSSNNSTISSLKASKTLFKAYQFKPLLKFLNSPNRRLLVADEVGLGKTIEAGHIMLELKARRELGNILIICPKSLQNKWKQELETKFGLVFKIYETGKELIQEMQNPRVSLHAIINYEKVRVRKDKGKKNTLASLTDYLSEKDFRFSLVLCDEAHKMRNKETQTYKGAELVMSHAESAVFLTATPVMISTENLYNLLHLLDNARYYNYQMFDNRLEENRPFVFALSSLNGNVPLKTIARELKNAEFVTRYFSDEKVIYEKERTVGKAFENDVMYQEIMNMLNGEDTPANRARLQYLISNMSMMNNVFSRTRKREVTTDLSQAERKPHMRKVVLTPQERTEYDYVIEQYIDDNSYTDEWGEEVMTQGGALGLVQKKRQIASSVYAYLNTESSLDRGVDMYEECTDAKFEELIKIIEEVFKHGTKKIVVFALFRKTLKYLELRFRKRGYGTLMIHGLIENRSEILNKFKNDPDAHILLSSEVGSEGLDMQFCNSMVNYDLPWNPMVVEQRIGRIDRFGQKSPTVNIYNLIVADSIQEDIYIRLLDRIGIFRGTIGDMEAILDAPLEKGGKVTIQDVYNKLEKELYTSKLTEEERLRKYKEIEQAIANEKENIEHLEEGLNNTLTNDAYFKDEISRIQKNKAYVTESELINYLESIIRQELTTCNLIEVEDGIYELKLPLSDKRILKNFLTRYQPAGDENTYNFNHFKQEIDGMTAIKMTFNQQIAYDNSDLMFVNIYHPLIQACLMYFEKKADKTKTSFCYAIPQSKELTQRRGYYLAVYQLSTKRNVLGVQKRTDILLPLLYDIQKKEVVDNEELTDSIFSSTQNDGIEYNPTADCFNSDMIQEMRYEFAFILSQKKKKMISELKLQMDSDRQRNEEQVINYYASVISNQENYITGWEAEMESSYVDKKRVTQLQGSIRLAESRISSFERQRDERLDQIREDAKIEISEEIVSLNLIKVV